MVKYVDLKQGISFRETIDELGENENVKAVVLRIDSPGGDPLTSDILWNSIEKLKKNKPIVVSMGNVAASGGYYIACNANKILANPMTITGSIGVWGTLPNLEGISSDIGINAEQVNTHKNSMGYSLFEPLQSGYKNAMERTIDEVYNLFKLIIKVPFYSTLHHFLMYCLTFHLCLNIYSRFFLLASLYKIFLYQK